jgi:hypothetical protein
MNAELQENTYVTDFDTNEPKDTRKLTFKYTKIKKTCHSSSFQHLQLTTNSYAEL